MKSLTARPVVSWVHCGDIHLKDRYNLGGMDRTTGLPLRFVDALDAIKKAVGWANDHKVDYLIFSGDVFDGPNPSEMCLQEFTQVVFSELHQSIDIVWLIGNHDTTGQYHAGQHLYSSGADIRFLYEYTLREVDDGKIGLHFLPWGSDLPQATAIRSLNIAIGHGEVRESKLGDYEKYCTAESAWDPDVLRSCFDHVELTHFHTRQEFYIGALVRSTFGEGTDPKGFTYTKVVRDAHGDESELRVESVLVDVADRRFVQVEVATVAEFQSEDFGGDFSGNIVKVILGLEFPTSAREDLRKRITEMGAIQVLTEKAKGSTVRSVSLPTQIQHPSEIVATYCKSLGMQDRTITLGQEILRSCGV